MLELRTLGGLDLRRTEGGTPGLIALQTKRLVLLAHLSAVPAGDFRRRDSLLALFWPDLDQEHARGALRQALHALRAALGDGVILTRGESEIGVNASMLHWDGQGLEAALQAGLPADALAFHRGDFLDGVFVADASPDLEEWIAGERTRLRRLAAKAAWAVAEGSPGRGEAGEAVRRAVRLSGDDEPALRRGIELLDRLGDHAGAIALFEEFARRVGRELEVEPSAETAAAIEAIRARSVPRGAGAATPRPDPPAGDGAAGPPGGSPTQGWRQRRLLIVAGTAVLAVLMIAGLRLGRGTGRPDESDVVAVAPFRVSGADSSHAWMQEGMVDLLTIRLAGAGGVRVADAAAVISSWRRAAPDDPAKDPVESARRLAADVGAEWVVTGSVVGTAGRVTLSARLEAVASGRTVARASAEGPTDSLPMMVDRLATLLLGGGAGLEDDRLSSLTSSSFPAVRAFLAGRAAFRRGRHEEALLRFREAVTLDSSFALAGLDLGRAAAWAGTEKDVELGVRRALAGRERLGPADRAFLDAWAGDFRDAPEMFRKWNAAVTAHPDSPETWYWLGDVYFHVGALAGIDDALGRAEAAFRRGWHLDSASSGAPALHGPPVAEPVEHMVQLAHLRGDTSEVRRLVERVIAADASSNLARTLAWHRALLAGPGARDTYWAGIGSANANVLLKISQFITWTGEGAADYPRVYDAERRALIAHDPGYAEFSLIVYALNRGRPGEVPGGATPPGRRPWQTRRYRLQTALWWEGDTTGVLAVVRALEAGSGKAPATPGEVGDRVLDLCTVGIWHATRGDFAVARRAGGQLGAAQLTGFAGRDSVQLADHATLCGSLIEAAAATGLASRDARARLSAADSLARHYVFAISDAPRIPEANLLLARLWEAQGDLPRALAAVRRRGGIFGGQPHFITTFVREEGRLAALTGDTAAAIRAYRHYLGLRYDPEPHLRPEVERVRRELAILEGR